MPFTKTQFLDVFKDYNLTVFPMQIVFNTLAVFCIFILFRSFSGKNKIINGYLSFLWLWIGIVYHLIFFSPINKAAYFFSILFIAQSVIFLYFGVIKGGIAFQNRNDFWGITGWILIIYALIIYPILGMITGHGYPYQPTFGLPCSTTIFTFGILLFSTNKLKWYLIILPFIWALIGFTAAFKLGIYEDIGLLISGLTILRNFKK